MSAQLEGVFDPGSVAPNTGEGGNLPVSDKDGHLVSITESEMKPTNDGTGKYLALNLCILEGPYKDQEGVHRLNLGNSSATAVAIAQRELSAICHVCNYLQPLQDVGVLHGKPFRVVVQPQKKNPEYTEVKKILFADGRKIGEEPKQGAAPTPPPASPPPASPPPAQTAPPAGFPTTTAVQPDQPPQPPAQAAPPQAQPAGWPAAPAEQPPAQPPQAAPPTQQMPWAQQGQ